MKKDIGRQVMFMRTDSEVARNGEGTFLRLKNGDIMFAYSLFAGETWYDNCSADIAVIISSDEGETWSKPRILIDHDDEAKNLMCPSLLRTGNGDVGLIFLRKSRDGINAVPYFACSSDEGISFSEPVRIIDDDINYYVAENDHALILKSGRIILPVNLHSKEINGVCKVIEQGVKCVFASDDNGKTWYELAERQAIPYPDKSETGLQETCIYQQQDGQLRALSRTDLGVQYECFSSDEGETWTEPEPNRFFSSPDSPLLMKRTGDFTVTVFNPIPNYTTRKCDGTWGRTPLVCAVSKDDGKSFPVIHMLESDPNNGYCYPAIFDGGDYMLVSYYHSDGSGVPLTATKIKKITFDELENWNVTYSGNFYSKGREKKGKKIAVDKNFINGEDKWLVPAVYTCSKGIVVDICIGINMSKMQKFSDDWRYCDHNEGKLSREERRKMERENPLNISFKALLELNGKHIRQKFGRSISYIPEELLPDGIENSEEATGVLNYYRLDKKHAWVFHRLSFPWTSKRDIKSMSIIFEHELTEIQGITFRDPADGEKIKFTHPLNGTEHTLTVTGTENHRLDNTLKIDGMLLPSHHRVMAYNLEPDISPLNFSVRDTEKNDEPMPCEAEPHDKDIGTSSAIAVIGGADGPTAVFFTKRTEQKNHSACSALKFNPAKSVEWQIVFREKTSEDMNIELI